MGDNPLVLKRRSQQSNFETVLQIIGMRSQPEDITDPEKTMESLSTGNWGTEYRAKTKIPVWKFTFTVSQQEVFSDDGNELGKLIQDCVDIPMIVGLDEWVKIHKTINVTEQYRNIYFEVTNDE